jgi:hypothetical protein
VKYQLSAIMQLTRILLISDIMGSLEDIPSATNYLEAIRGVQNIADILLQIIPVSSLDV